MAMDALKNLTNNIPPWQVRLDELSSQIERRQAELAAVSAAEAKSADVKSLRNVGSTESLKPKDDGPSHFSPDADLTGFPAVPLPEETQVHTPLETTAPPHNAQDRQPYSTDADATSPTRSQKQARDLAAAHSRAAAQAKKRHRSASVVSAEGAVPTYRSRNAIIVYYDSYVQKFFDDLVRFVSSGRNLMRKAKMAAKVAQIKRLAELELPDDDASGDDKNGLDALPSLRYMSTRRFGPMGGLGRSAFGASGQSDQTPDVYDNLDKALEFVQATCEHGAHQFLRDADCNDELKKIQQRMAKVLEMAAKEMERIEREEPELAKETGELEKARTMRPISMRRDLSASQKEGILLARDEPAKLEVAKPEPSKNTVFQATTPCQIDAAIEADEGIEMDQELPILQYRSTRQMRARAA
ncbi:hypothetical protein HJFPF1_03309 [Paramyrothecium foliicola]|nr:hypothetical protein HJFPF1_03309 [Paramyrothecium foliicola]